MCHSSVFLVFSTSSLLFALSQVLTLENYVSRFSTLLFMEEVQNEIEMHEFDMSEVIKHVAAAVQLAKMPKNTLLWKSQSWIRPWASRMFHTGTQWNVLLPWTKKKRIIEIRGEKNTVPRVISCSIRRDQRRAKVADSCGSDLPCADRTRSSMISHVEQRSSRRESRWWFFFFVQGSMNVWVLAGPLFEF